MEKCGKCERYKQKWCSIRSAIYQIRLFTDYHDKKQDVFQSFFFCVCVCQLTAEPLRFSLTTKLLKDSKRNITIFGRLFNQPMRNCPGINTQPKNCFLFQNRNRNYPPSLPSTQYRIVYNYLNMQCSNNNLTSYFKTK